jgi:hypothetical protein
MKLAFKPYEDKRVQAVQIVQVVQAVSQVFTEEFEPLWSRSEAIERLERFEHSNAVERLN